MDNQEIREQTHYWQPIMSVESDCGGSDKLGGAGNKGILSFNVSLLALLNFLYCLP